MKQIEEKLGAQFEKYVNEKEIAGASLIVRKKGEQAYQTQCGYANIETREPLTEKSIFRLASMTKPITAIAAMMLVEQGRLSLESSIAEFLPDYMNKKAVTIRDLLNHSSGLGQGPASLDYVEKCFDPKDKLVERILKWAGMPFDFQPGTETGYSALVGFDLLGRIIEIVSETDLQTYFRQSLFEPLGIQNGTYTLTPEQEVRLVRLYESENGTLKDVTETDKGWLTMNPNNGYFSAGAGLFGTLEDYDKIVQLLAGEGVYEGNRLLKAESVYQMRTESSKHKKELSPGVVWGMGMIVFRGREGKGSPLSSGTYGWSGAFGTHFFIDVQKNIQVVLMLNRSNINGAGSYISREIEKLVYEIYG